MAEGEREHGTCSRHACLPRTGARVVRKGPGAVCVGGVDVSQLSVEERHEQCRLSRPDLFWSTNNSLQRFANQFQSVRGITIKLNVTCITGIFKGIFRTF